MSGGGRCARPPATLWDPAGVGRSGRREVGVRNGAGLQPGRGDEPPGLSVKQSNSTKRQPCGAIRWFSSHDRPEAYPTAVATNLQVCRSNNRAAEKSVKRRGLPGWPRGRMPIRNCDGLLPPSSCEWIGSPWDFLLSMLVPRKSFAELSHSGRRIRSETHFTESWPRTDWAVPVSVKRKPSDPGDVPPGRCR